MVIVLCHLDAGTGYSHALSQLSRGLLSRKYSVITWSLGTFAQLSGRV